MGGVVGVVVLVVIIAIICYVSGSKKTEEDNLYQECQNELVGVDGFFSGQKIPIHGEIVIGRDPDKCSLVYPADAKGVSSLHCKVIFGSRGIGVIDLKSSCGTFRMSGERMSPGEICYLDVGDGFYVGERKNTFLIR